MKTINKIFPLFLVLFFLIACKPTFEKPSLYNFKQGYNSLVITTLENAPPREVYQNTNFKIILKLENQGAYDLTEGKVSILGFVPQYIFLEKDNQPIDHLEGRSPANPSGDVELLEFSLKAQELFPGMESYLAPYYLVADYQYKTEFTPTVCINPELYEVYDSGCKVQAQTFFNGQGSPLAVTQLEEIIHPGARSSVEFRLTLKNKGRGEIKQVTLTQAKMGGQTLSCKFKDSQTRETFTFPKKQQETVLICTRLLKDRASYFTTLSVEFSFDYSLKEKKTLTLKK